ncbi:MAG: glycerol-phosphatase [Cryptosporangiaceae bacterium]|nr:glycerol-phosphatase [Cryptosporangiaceae bacterium]MDQ1655493.1 glycerol-phosphatase [Cryptosporangiaceae bacterium]
MPSPDPRPRGSAGPLTELYDVALLDLDGVVYLQEEPIPEAAAALNAARAAGMRLEFVTNNASRRAPEVAALLARVGVAADPVEVVTSAQAAAALLAERLAPGSAVLVVGGDALAGELTDVGLRAVRSADDDPLAVVQGYTAETGWRQLAEATIAIRAGALWIASNGDATFPSPRGPLPGNGALVAAVATATGRSPDEIVGKPHPRLHQESVRRSGAQRPLVVGDRLDTDIEGAINGDCDSLLVLTGVTTPADLIAAGPRQRPDYLAADLRGLLEPHPTPTLVPGGAECRGWTVTADAGELRLGGRGLPIDALRALCAAAWSGGSGAEKIVADGPEAESAVAGLSL